MLRRGVIPVLAIIGSGGCLSPPVITIEQRDVSITYVLPGIEGAGYFNRSIANGLKRGGVRGAVEIFDWTTRAGPLGWFNHLSNETHHQVQGMRLARHIVRYQRKHPGEPIFIVAHSGGAGIALIALEALPDTKPIDGIILLAGAVSPDHDLTKALSRTRGALWNFYSPRDIFFLVMGTTLFGTIDRTHEASAGAVGFRLPADLSEEGAIAYETKLHDIPWDKEMGKFGHYGGHSSSSALDFVAEYLAPIIRDAEESPPSDVPPPPAGSAPTS
ncbi:MAG: hypothetical protein HOP29_12850 [Phycisphaerales bacterium]|nr:hypothetical protein [Phycisphaerales bacterium]